MRKRIIVITDHELSREERKNYANDHPGCRLCFMLRYPNFPFYLGGAAAIFSAIVLLVKL